VVETIHRLTVQMTFGEKKLKGSAHRFLLMALSLTQTGHSQSAIRLKMRVQRLLNYPLDNLILLLEIMGFYFSNISVKIMRGLWVME